MIEMIKAYVYDYTIGKYREYSTRIGRALSFAKIGYSNYDWDDFYLFKLEVFKLKRMLDVFENHGHHSPTCNNYKPKMKSIRLAIKLGERYMNHRYFRFHDMHEKKYGKTEFGSEPIEGSDCSLMITLKNGVKYERTKLETEDMMEAYRKDRAEEERDRVNFYKIIIKYGRYWWD